MATIPPRNGPSWQRVAAWLVAASVWLAGAADAARAEPTGPGSPGRSVAATALPLAGATARPRVARTGEGWLLLTGRGRVAGSAGRTVRYTVEVADGLERRQDLRRFARFVVDRLGHPTFGWAAGGDVRLQRVGRPSTASIRVLLAAPATVDRLCAAAGLRTRGRYSCWTGRIAALNADRWFHGVDHVPSLRQYRTYLVNHEVGHGLGHGHRACTGSGHLASVMMQLTKSTYGCRPNGWPYPPR